MYTPPFSYVAYSSSGWLLEAGMLIRSQLQSYQTEGFDDLWWVETIVVRLQIRRVDDWLWVETAVGVGTIMLAANRKGWLIGGGWKQQLELAFVVPLAIQKGWMIGCRCGWMTGCGLRQRSV